MFLCSDNCLGSLVLHQTASSDSLLRQPLQTASSDIFDSRGFYSASFHKFKVTVKTEFPFTAGRCAQHCSLPSSEVTFQKLSAGLWVGAQCQLYRLTLRFVPIEALRNFGSHRARNLVSNPPKIPVEYWYLGFLEVICYTCTGLQCSEYQPVSYSND